MRQKLLLFLAILLPLSQAAFAQTTVKGKVVDETGEPAVIIPFPTFRKRRKILLRPV